jgi:hypothetical protein
MRTYSRDWIAWTLLLTVIIVVAADYYVREQVGVSTPEYVYKIVATPQR